MGAYGGPRPWPDVTEPMTEIERREHLLRFADADVEVCREKLALARLRHMAASAALREAQEKAGVK